MSTNDAWAHTPRQYRPYTYVSALPKSTSMSYIDRIDPKDQKASYSYVPSTPSRNVPAASTFNRRRTDSSFPRPPPLHSAPTVAKSGLTASVSANDLSQPSPRKFRFAKVHEDNPRFSRIPTPVRHASTPVLPSQRAQKENMHPKTHRLLGPISPTRNNAQPTQPMPKSRTLGMLSSITSSFSRSNLNLSNSRQTSASSNRSAADLSATPTSSSSPLSVTSNTRQVHTAQPNSYWCGRFQALNDRFHNEALEVFLQDSSMLKQYIEEVTPSPRPKPKLVSTLKGKSQTQSDEMDIVNSCSRTMLELNDKRLHRVFLHLQAQCVTSDAKKSLWDWQLAFARIEQNEKLLPVGGKMEERPGWVSRVGRAFIGNSSDSSLGRKTGMSQGGRKASVLDGAKKGRYEK